MGKVYQKPETYQELLVESKFQEVDKIGTPFSWRYTEKSLRRAAESVEKFTTSLGEELVEWAAAWALC